ncbi:NUDIX domain-containing protein [Dongia sp.]|uniref:NUDIX hydrolase n=1 Tax=Dongia sp. TaxID=1977262 RepID=UPI0035B188B2
MGEQPTGASVEFPGPAPLWPVSIKGVLFIAGQVVLLKNERDEWELPGGRLEAGEEPDLCLAREIAEELGIGVKVGDLLDCWRYPVLPQREVLIVTFEVQPLPRAELRLSHEHKALGRFPIGEIAALPMPAGYRRSIQDWAARIGL